MRYRLFGLQTGTECVRSTCYTYVEFELCQVHQIALSPKWGRSAVRLIATSRETLICRGNDEQIHHLADRPIP